MNPISDIMQNKSNQFPQHKTNKNQVPPASAYDRDEQDTSDQETNSNMGSIQGVNLNEIANQTSDVDDNSANSTNNANQSNVEKLLNFTKNIKSQLNGIISVLEQMKNNEKNTDIKNDQQKRDNSEISSKKIEGVFDGKKMIGSDTNQYEVPISFINNKKLVEGDLLKLTLHTNGKKDFKQAGSVKRERMIGSLFYDNKNKQWKVKANNESLNIMNDFANFYNFKEGHKVSVLVPENGNNSWATIENIFN